MEKRTFQTPKGSIAYWVGGSEDASPCLVFLPGLTADHRLFDKQIAHFESLTRCLVWDAPGHAASRPFALEFTLDDWAVWLRAILEREAIGNIVLVGQSMGGYCAQVFMELFPGRATGFVSIDSAPLQRHCYARWELWFLKHTELMYRSIPWKLLLTWGSRGTAETPYGRDLMRRMMEDYCKRDYCKLVAFGYKQLALAVEADRPYEIACPAQLICGQKDAAGFTRRYNREWAARAGLPLAWIPGAGHNANTDDPASVNQLIEKLLAILSAK